MNAIQMFEYILNSGTRTTTYKYGLLTGIVDYIIENPLEPPKNNFHFIPIFHLARQFLVYYYPLVLEGIRQGPDMKERNPTKIKPLIEDFQQDKERLKSFTFVLDIENTNLLYSLIDEADELPESLVRLLFEIRKIIIDQPLQYIRNVKDSTVSLFGLLSTKDPIQNDFEDHRKTGLLLKWNDIKSSTNWNDLLTNENLQLFFGHQTFQEISEMRFWLRDVLVKRWAQECIERFDATNPNLLSLFDMWKRTPQRDTESIKNYRMLYLESGLRMCLYCNQFIEKDLELDHLFPWSRFPVNSFWNLYPVCSNCNSKKSDKIPVISKEIDKRISNHLGVCLKMESKNPIIRMDIDKLYRRRFNSNPDNVSTEQKVKEILEYLRNLSSNFLESIPGYLFDI